MTLSHFTTSDGLRLAYDDRGTGLPLLCLPGLTRNMDDFDTLLEPLAGRCRLIRMDYRGRGRSDYDPDFNNYNLLREAHDVVELLDHLGLAQVAILGTSRGGLIAMALAAGFPQRLTGVILNDIGPVVGTAGLARIMEYVGKTPPQPDLDTLADAMVRQTTGEFPGVTAQVWHRHVAHWFAERPEGGLSLRYDPALHKALLAQAATGALQDMWVFFDALKAFPLAVIRGANSDILSAETLAEMRRRHPVMLVAEIADRGHVPFLDEPEALALIGAFLDTLPPLPQGSPA
ncbi:alpha/beta fold hydrolase [Frigidibacter mobilis]|uniref:Alpha/beta fold family hydrolase n=1 Tax=Frigidibacter mobilis TaxID=1335048 RepID=A0A159Z209_9RHOB|nr:alpha/beta hydrolase [Frigidibacter mobilis]AMY68128.1 alpha/beta fold family hydrolase [Frigidibacter mobilis]